MERFEAGLDHENRVCYVLTHIMLPNISGILDICAGLALLWLLVTVWVCFESSAWNFQPLEYPVSHKNTQESRPRNRLNQLNIKFKFMHDLSVRFPVTFGLPRF
jgi:hypothetical protein